MGLRLYKLKSCISSDLSQKKESNKARLIGIYRYGHSGGHLPFFGALSHKHVKKVHAIFDRVHFDWQRNPLFLVCLENQLRWQFEYL